MIQTIENDFLRISVNDLGAELCSVYDKEKDCELLWQADPAFWKRHAPVLFPNVGRHYKNIYRINGKSYPSGQHGFARDSVFTCLKTTEACITHSLSSTEETLKVYPFPFELIIHHTLCDRTLTVSWEVRNIGEETMYFTIGAHPAFRVPLHEGEKQSDYHLKFNGKASLTYLLIEENENSGTINADTSYTLALENESCPIDAHMFDKDALVFDNSQISQVAITHPDGRPYIEMFCEGFPTFGIWSVPGAEFVCLEPWMGRCDDYGYTGTLVEKAYINKLSPSETFTKDYSVKFHK